MSFQRTPGFQIGFQQTAAGAAAGPAPFQVVLFPRDDSLRFGKLDKMLYALAVYARDARGQARRETPSYDFMVRNPLYA